MRLTRVNCVPVEELTNRHLLAEYREIPRIYRLVQKAIDRGESPGTKVPDHYTMGTGHVRFFYNKLEYVLHRQIELRDEMLKRGMKPVTYANPESVNHGIDHPGFWNDWKPSPTDQNINRRRIAARLRRSEQRKREKDLSPPQDVNAFLEAL